MVQQMLINEVRDRTDEKKKVEKLEEDLGDLKKDQMKYESKAKELQSDGLPESYASKEELQQAIADHEKVVETLKKKWESIK